MGAFPAGLCAVLAMPGPVAACSPPFNPTIAALGPDQIVLVGTTGEPVAGGRLFHVELVFNGTPATPRRHCLQGG